MKDIFATIGKILGLVFAAALIAFTGLMTVKLGKRMIPDDVLMQIMILVLFDAAALVWFVSFITQAKGTMQWAIAGLGWLIGLVGAVIMTAGELILGQQLIILDDPTRFGWILIATVVVAALGHVTLVYFFHFADPATRNRIENAQKVSKAIETAYNNARQMIDNQTDALTAGLVESALHEAQQQINAVTAYHVRNAAKLESHAGEVMRGGPVVDAESQDAPKKHKWVFPPARKSTQAPKPNGPEQTLHSETIAVDPTLPQT